MDEYKIAEAASTIKKTKAALGWLKGFGTTFQTHNVFVDTRGNATAIAGHGEVTPYLRKAFEPLAERLIVRARRIAEEEKKEAEELIRREVHGETESPAPRKVVSGDGQHDTLIELNDQMIIAALIERYDWDEVTASTQLERWIDTL